MRRNDEILEKALREQKEKAQSKIQNLLKTLDEEDGRKSDQGAIEEAAVTFQKMTEQNSTKNTLMGGITIDQSIL